MFRPERPLIEALIKEGDEIVSKAESIEPNNASVIEFRRLVNQAKAATTTEARRQALIKMEALEDEVKSIAKAIPPPAGEEMPHTLPLEQVSKLETRIPLDLIRKDEAVEIERLTKEIREEGIKEPIVIRVRDGGSRVVWDGIHRLIVAQILGIKNLPVKFIGAIEKLPKTETGNPGFTALEGGNPMRTGAERISFHERIFGKGAIPPLERLRRGQTTNELMPMPPEEGPPLPRMFALRWPWKK